jgi:hypothetical protein
VEIADGVVLLAPGLAAGVREMLARAEIVASGDGGRESKAEWSSGCYEVTYEERYVWG